MVRKSPDKQWNRQNYILFHETIPLNKRCHGFSSRFRESIWEKWQKYCPRALTVLKIVEVSFENVTTLKILI
jgi:hypothetical protein